MHEEENNEYQKIRIGVLNNKIVAWAFLALACIWGVLQFGNDAFKFISSITKNSDTDRRELQVKLLPIYFEFDSSEINKESLGRLTEYVVWIRDANPMKMLIESHVNERAPSYNIPLSRKRAEAVAMYFITKGIEPSHIEARGLGATKPAKPTRSQYNSRAEIKLSW